MGAASIRGKSKAICVYSSKFFFTGVDLEDKKEPKEGIQIWPVPQGGTNGQTLSEKPRLVKEAQARPVALLNLLDWQGTSHPTGPCQTVPTMGGRHLQTQQGLAPAQRFQGRAGITPREQQSN